jgi:hypothetical protein
MLVVECIGPHSKSASLALLSTMDDEMVMLRHSIIAGKCYRDRFGAIYRVISFDGSGVQCVVYGRDSRGRIVEREHADSWPDFLEELQGEVECPQPS